MSTDPAVQAQILELRRQGQTLAQIQAATGLSPNRVQYVLYSHGLKLTPEQNRKLRGGITDPGVRDRVINLRGQGLTLAQIQAETKLTSWRVQDLLYRNGVKLTPEQNRKVRGGVAYTDADKTRALELRRQGQTLTEIVVATGIQAPVLKLWFRSQGLKLTRDQKAKNLALAATYTPEQLQWVRELRGQGKKFLEIAEATGIPFGNVRYLCRQQQLVLTQEQRQRNREVRRSKYTWIQLQQKLAESNLSIVLPDNSGAFVEQIGNIAITCHCGRVFTPSSVHDFIDGRSTHCGCLKSAPEMELAAFVRALGIEFSQGDRQQIRPLELDIWIPGLKLGIEYCGLYWHGEVCLGETARMKHLLKLRACEKAGIRLLTVFADEWTGRRLAVEGYLRSVLNGSLVRVGARTCALSSCEFKDIEPFMEEHHVLGAGVSGGWNYKLTAPDGVVVAAASFGNSFGEGFRLLRYCVRAGYRVPGGLGRFLARFREEAGPGAITTLADRRWSHGGVYRALGFELKHQNQPSYWYFQRACEDKRIHKSNLRRGSPIRRGLDIANEWEAAQALGLDRIWDCGTDCWVLK